MPLPAGITADQIPAFDLTPTTDKRKPSPLIGGLAAGFHELVGLGGSAIQGAGTLLGIQPVADYGQSVAESQNATAARVGRPDLETAPWRPGGASIAPWLEYQIGKLAPTLAGYAAATLAVPEAVLPAAAAEFLPEFIGGVSRGAAGFGAATGFGQAAQSAAQAPNGLTRGSAFKALLETPLYTAANVLEPGFLGHALQGTEGKLLSRVATQGLKGSAVGTVQAGALAGLDQTFRPDIAPQDKMANIVDAAVTGASIGGVLGGVTGIRSLKRANPAAIDNETLAGTVDQALGLPAPPAFVDAMGRAVVGSGGDATLRAEPVQPTSPQPIGEPASPALIGPENIANRGVVPGSTIVVGRRDETGRFTSQPTGVEHPPVVPEDTSRAFRNFTDEELSSAANALANKREAEGKLSAQQNEIARGVDEELAFRQKARNATLTTPDVSTEPVEAVSASANRRGTGEQTPAAPASANYDNIASRVSELTQGLRLPTQLRDRLAASRSEKDIENIVHDEVIVAGKGGKMRDTLAQRVGVLDNEGRPTPLADEVSSRKTPEGEPVPSAMFLRSWRDSIKGTTDQQLRDLKPVNESDAQLKLYRALGDKEVSDAMETQAQKFGILNENKQLTPLAVELAKRDPIPTKTAVDAAQAQGFKGAAASMFERGVRGYTGGDAILTRFDSTRQGEAYQAGVKWAEETNSVPRGALKKYEPARYTGEVTDEQRQLGAKVEVKKGEIPPEVKQGQLVNEAIDNAGLSPVVHEGDIAQLKGMVRRGDIEGAMEGLRRVQRGEGLFQQPNPQTRDFVGETTTPGAPRVPRTAELVPTRAEREASSKQAIFNYHKKSVLLNIQDAFEAGEVSGPQRLRLVDRAVRGDLKGAAAGLPDRFKERVGEAPDNGGVAKSVAQRTVDNITGKWRSDINIAVHETTADVPSELRDQLSSDSVLGFFDKASNTMHIIANNHASPEDVTATVYHELLGHKGLQNAFGSRLDKLMGDVYRTNKAMRDRADAYLRQTGKWVGAPEETRRRNAVEEIFAAGSENGVVGTTAWEKVVSAIRNFGRRLGLDLNYNAADVQAILARAHDSIVNGFNPVGDVVSSAPPQIAERIRDSINSITDKVDKSVDREGLKGILRRGQLYATSIHHITEFYGKPWFTVKRADGFEVNGVVQREQVIGFKEAVKQRHAQFITDSMDRAYELAHTDKKAFETLNQLMDMTQYGIHPARVWENQIKEVRDNPTLKPIVEQANNMYRSLQTKGHIDIYEDFRKFNDIGMLAKTALSLHDHVSTDRVTGGRIERFSENPMRRFMDEQAREGYGLQEAHDFWNKELDSQVAAIEEFSKANEFNHPKEMSASDKGKMASSINTMRSQVEGVRQVRERLDAFPNFHLGRDGEYFIDMKLRLGADGKVDPTAMAAAAERLAQYGRVISPHSGADHIYFRVDSTVAQANLLRDAEALQKEGIVRADKLDEARGVTDHAIISGKRSDDRVQARLADQWSNRLIEEIRANEHITPEDKKFLTNAIRAQAVDLTPDNSLSKVMTHRDNVPGFDPDMLRSFNSRGKLMVDALAGMAVARDITDSYSNMREAVAKARTTPSSRMSIAQRNGMTEVADELSKRDRFASEQIRSSKALDQLQAFSGAFFLSANLAYPAVNLIQVPMIALPELGSRYGFANAARAMARATPESLKIIRAIAKNGLKVSAARAADAVVTVRALEDAGVTGHKIEFLMQVANRGGVDIGGQSREMARNARGVRGNKFDQRLRVASSLGYYSETLSRLVVALAEYQLHDKNMSADKMAETTVRTLKESMWDYSSPNTARMLSRNGFLGKLTPLATQFMKYTAMLNEKLYREVHAALGGDERARRFLLQHLAMTTVFAGTLGLPFASVFASTYDMLKDWLAPRDEPSDIQASFRNGLADVFGKGAAEIVARGTPRLAGVDLSTRVGEQDILPFSKFIADRRDLKDSLKDLESRAWGAPSSMMLNMATGAQQVAQGDVESGLRQMLPLGLASMVKAYQMTDKGFTDSKGNVLPMEPSARDILAQAVGFNPAQNAEYNEARSDQMQRQGLLRRQSTQLRSQIVDAMLSGDRESARPLIEQAMEFDKLHPAFSVLRGVEGSIRRRQQAQIVSQRTGVPLGVSPRDTAAPALTRYADVELRAQ